MTSSVSPPTPSSPTAESIFKDWLLAVKKDLYKRGAFWHPTLITQAMQGRTVVLRQLDDTHPNDSALPDFIVHTDTRAQKWQQLQQHSECALHFYCPKRKWQMRLNGEASLHYQDTFSQDHWQRLSNDAQRLYALQHCPGEPVDDPAQAFCFNSITEAQQNFAVIRIRARVLESLQLPRPDKADYHIRARWQISEQRCEYLAP